MVEAVASEMLFIIPSENGALILLKSLHFGFIIKQIITMDIKLDKMQDEKIKIPALKLRSIPLPTATITKAGPGLIQNIKSMFAVLLSIIPSFLTITT